MTRTTRLSPRTSSLVLAILATLAGTFALSDPAGATSATYTSTDPCSASVNNGICVSQVSADYTSTTITLSMTVGVASNPVTDPNWSGNSATFVSWVLPTDGASATDYSSTYAAIALVADGEFVGSVVNLGSESVLCDINATTVNYSANTYTISFPSSCIGSADSFQTYALFQYDTSNGADAADAATAEEPPETSSPCCEVTPDVSTTTSSTTTTTTSTSTTTSTTTPTTSTTTSTTIPSSTTTSTSAPAAAVVSSPSVSSPSSTGNTGSGSGSGSGSGNGSSSASLASTGPGNDTLVLIVAGVGMVAMGVVGRRRLVEVARRAKRPVD